MTATIGTRVFFVESTAHWEALQKERAQSLVSPFSTSRATCNNKEIRKKERQPTNITQQSIPPKGHRQQITIGNPGSRRRKRWENNNLKNNPVAILYPEDLKPPGHQYATNYFQWQLDIDQDREVDTDNNDNNDSNDKDDNNSGMTMVELPCMSRQMKNDLKRNHVPEGYVRYYEQQLVDYLSRQQQSDDHHHTLIWEIDDSYLRWVVHAICRHYNVGSYSKTTEDGRRMTFVECIDGYLFEAPPLSFFECYLKK